MQHTPRQYLCKYRATKMVVVSWWLTTTICNSSSNASLNFTSKPKTNVLFVVHSILWRQESRQQQTGNERRVSEGKIIKITETETDVRRKNWDQTDNDSETVVKNTAVKTMVEVQTIHNDEFLAEGSRKTVGGDAVVNSAVNNCIPSVFLAVNLTQTEWISSGVRVLQDV